MKAELQSARENRIVLSRLSPASAPDNLPLDILIAFSLSAITIILVLTWFAFDHRIPTPDEGVHIFNSFTVAELVKHARPWQYQWWYHLVAVSTFYPPFVYFVNSLVLLAFGESRYTEALYTSLYSGLLVSALYAVVRLLNGGRLAACCAGLFICAYPIIAWLSHSWFIDLPGCAMVALSLAMFLWWRRSDKPSMVRTGLAGAVIGLACMSKQTVFAYVGPLGIYFLFLDLIAGLGESKRAGKIAGFSSAIHSLSLILIAAVISAPFLLVSLKLYRSWLNTNAQAFVGGGVHHSFVTNLTGYLAFFARSNVLAITFSICLGALFFAALRLSLAAADYRLGGRRTPPYLHKHGTGYRDALPGAVFDRSGCCFRFFCAKTISLGECGRTPGRNCGNGGSSVHILQFQLLSLSCATEYDALGNETGWHQRQSQHLWLRRVGLSICR